MPNNIFHVLFVCMGNLFFPDTFMQTHIEYLVNNSNLILITAC